MADKYINPSGLQTIKEWVEGKIPTATSDLTNDSGFATETYVNTAVSGKQNTLTAGNNIDITNDTISVDGTIPLANMTNGIHFGIVDGTSTSTVFTATVTGITALTDGTAVLLKNGVVTSASGFTLNINSLGAKPVYNNMAAASAETTVFNKDYTMLFVYDSTRVSGGAWILYRGYNSDTLPGRGYIDYYYRPYAGQAVYRYKFCMIGEDNRMYPVTITNQESATQVSKVPTSVGLRASAGIWYYSGTTTIAAAKGFGAQTLYPAYYGTTAVYNFNESTGTYKNIYLRGTYDKTTDMFTLYNDGATPCKSYYTFVPDNTANITLSSYFVSGYYYILLGASYSTTNYFSLFGYNPLYYFDGTNLIPVATKVTQDIVNTAVAGKQDTLTFDTSPTANSTNPVTSGGIYTAIQNAISSSTDIFWGTYGTTTYSQITTALSNNQLPVIAKDSAYYVYTGINEGVYYFSFCIAMSIGFGVNAGIVASCSLNNSDEWGAVGVTIPTEDDIQTEINGIVANYLPLSGGTLTGSLTLNGAPTSNLEAATKKYVDDNTTNKQGTITANGILKGNGNGSISAAVAGTDYQAPLTFDNAPTANSTNPVTSGGVYTAIQDAISSGQDIYWCTYGTTTVSEITTALQANKLPVVSATIDGNTVLCLYRATESNNNVTIHLFCADLSFLSETATYSVMVYGTDTWDSGSWDIATKSYVDTALSGKQNTLTFDNTPTANSDNPVKSGGIKQYVDEKAPFFVVEQEGSNNPTLQQLIQKYNNGEILLLQSVGVKFTAVATNITSDDPSERTIGLAWTMVAPLYGTYIILTSQLINETLEEGQTYDASQDTWSQSYVLMSNYVTETAMESYVSNAVSGKQDILTFDSTPTANSTNPVTSGGIAAAIANVDKFFIATYGTTTVAQLETAYQAGKMLMLYDPNEEFFYSYGIRYSNKKFEFVGLLGESESIRAVNDNNSWSYSNYILVQRNSPSLTGTPTAPTASSGTNTTQIATTAFVQTAVGNIKDVYVCTYNSTSFDDILAAYNAGKFLVCKYNQLYFPLANANAQTLGSFYFAQVTNTGRLAGVTAEDTGSTTSWSISLNLTVAPLASPAFTGTPTAPTATAGTNTTQIATTAFVQTAISNISIPTIYVQSAEPSSWGSGDLWLEI